MYVSRSNPPSSNSNSMSSLVRRSNGKLLAASSLLSTCAAFACLATHNHNHHPTSSGLVVPPTSQSRSTNVGSPRHGSSRTLVAWMAPLALSLSSSTPTEPPSSRPSLGAARRSLEERFRVGDYYIWLYEDDSGTPTSYEKYEITKATHDEEDGTLQWMEIEMATKFSKNDTYAVHHRMTVNLPCHLDASKNHNDWKLEKIEYATPTTNEPGEPPEHKWTVFGDGTNVVAFEEKFDCFSMLSSSSDDTDIDTGTGCSNKNGSEERFVVVDSIPLKLVRTSRHSYTEAWYAHVPNNTTSAHSFLSGIALTKQFQEHSFALIEVGRKGEPRMPVQVVEDSA